MNIDSEGIAPGNNFLSRIKVTEFQDLPEAASVLLEELKEGEEVVTNLVKVIANSTPVLGAYVSAQKSIGHCSLKPGDVQRIGLAVSEICQSEYCLAAHTAFARVLGMSNDEIRDSRNAISVNPKQALALKFCVNVVNSNGHVQTKALEELRRAGFDDQQIVELIALTSLSMFSCYLANVAQVPRGFREAEPKQ